MPLYMATHLTMRDPYFHDIVLWESPPIGARIAFRDAGIARSPNADFRWSYGDTTGGTKKLPPAPERSCEQVLTNEPHRSWRFACSDK
jgi:hypothetical protein